jgi:hypothetical protein
MPRLTERYIELRIGAERFRARLLVERAPVLAAAVWRRLPLRVALIQDEWSGAMLRSVRTVALRAGARDQAPPYQHPGLLLLERAGRRVALCYGHGRLQDGMGPISGVPFAEIAGADLAALERLGRRFEFEGAREATIARAAEQRSPLAPRPAERGRRIEVRLGEAVATARLLEESAPVTTASFASRMPLAGTGTNIVLNGPLIRLRTPSDTSRDETILESDPREATETLLVPGHVYYRIETATGVRISFRHATVMYGRLGGEPGETRFSRGPFEMAVIPYVCLARFDGDWSAFQAEAERLSADGQKTLSFTLLER